MKKFLTENKDWIIIILFVITAWAVIYSSNKKVTTATDNCIKTNLVGIGKMDAIVDIYDCSNKEGKKQ